MKTCSQCQNFNVAIFRKTKTISLPAPTRRKQQSGNVATRWSRERVSIFVGLKPMAHTKT